MARSAVQGTTKTAIKLLVRISWAIAAREKKAVSF
jgi:hypothetical protein